MTETQFERWRDFALRMARTCFRRDQRPNEAWIISTVEDFFDRFSPGDAVNILSWDTSTDDWYMCDEVSEFLAERCMFRYRPTCRACGYASAGEACSCDESRDLAYEQWDEQWGGPIHCCIRAGLDCAAEPSAGVVGFTAGDLRRMYPEGVPGWVVSPDDRLRYWLSNEPNGTFAELPDSAGMVL